MALTWELVKSDLPDPTKKATILEFDRVLGLRLAEWETYRRRNPRRNPRTGRTTPTSPRTEKRWADADALRDQITAAGYTIEDTREGPKITAA